MRKTTSTKSLRQVAKGLYVLDWQGSPMAVIRKAGKDAWESRPFGAAGTWTRHETLAQAMGSELASKVNAEPIRMLDVMRRG